MGTILLTCVMHGNTDITLGVLPKELSTLWFETGPLAADLELFTETSLVSQ